METPPRKVSTAVATTAVASYSRCRSDVAVMAQETDTRKQDLLGSPHQDGLGSWRSELSVPEEMPNKLKDLVYVANFCFNKIVALLGRGDPSIPAWAELPEWITKESKFAEGSGKALSMLSLAWASLVGWAHQLRDRNVDIQPLVDRIYVIQRSTFLDIKNIHDDLQSSLTIDIELWNSYRAAGRLNIVVDCENLIQSDINLSVHGAERRYRNSLKEMISMVRQIDLETSLIRQMDEITSKVKSRKYQ